MTQVPLINKNGFSFRDKHSAAQRIWHWSSSLAILALLCTVLIASTILKPRNNVTVIQTKLLEKGIRVSADEAKGVAKSINKQIWIWHKYIGVSLAILFLFRIVLEFFEPAGQNLGARIRKAALYLRTTVPKSKNARHYLIVKYFYLFFYTLVLVMVLTGLGIIYADDFSVLKEFKENLKDIHSVCMYGVIGFIILHIGGVLLAELRGEPGITSDMINGGKSDRI
jgi:Ni/Fe-hydrogenase 1 B-type cytochrome subunit